METLEKNSESMKTVVETYLIEETVDLIYDSEKLEKWNNLVTSLELKGQGKLVKPDKSPIPFLYMKTGIKNIFQTLCPRKFKIQEFDLTPIPVEILDLVALSQREGYFSSFEIWADEKNPDPACVGVVEKWVLHKKGTYTVINSGSEFTTKTEAENFCIVNSIDADTYHQSWDDKHYLIGRWADVKSSLNELREIAKQRFINEKGDELLLNIKKLQREHDDIVLTANEKFN
jgi:hypothetical protein